jgi:hypothetical protein
MPAADPQEAYNLALLLTARTNGEAGGHPRVLPIGACTSPHLTNLIFAPVDRLIRRELGVTYTRYADNLFLSYDSEGLNNHLASDLSALLYANGFLMHEPSTMRKGPKRQALGIHF